MFSVSAKTLIAISSLLIIDFGTEASVQVHHQTDYLFNELPQERIEQFKIPADETLVVRLPSNSLLKYTSYKDVSILHFRIPPDTRTAFFSFKAVEESKSAFQRQCKPRDVSLHLKASSYPVISPENITFPRNFLSPDERFKVHDLQLRSNEIQHRVIIPGPQVGNWFAVAFVSWTDPNNDRIEQQGLTASCDTLLLAEMSVSRFHPIIINNGQVHNGNLTSNNNVIAAAAAAAASTGAEHQHENDNKTRVHAKATLDEALLHDDNRKPNYSPQQTWEQPHFHFQSATHFENQFGNNNNNYNRSNSNSSSSRSNSRSSNDTDKSTTNNEIIYKFYVPPNIGEATARISFAQVCLQCPELSLHIQANAFPNTDHKNSNNNDNENNYIHRAIIYANQTDEISIKFNVQPSTWHYALLKFDTTTDNHMGVVGRNSGQLTPMTIAALLAFENSLNRLRSRRQNRKTVSDTTTRSNETVWYNVQYTLQIDYQDPVVNDVNNELTNAGANNVLKGNGKSNHNNSNTTNRNGKAWRPIILRDMEFYPLLRQTYREFFMFDYDLMPDINGTVPVVLNLTAGTPAGFAFELGEVNDIGGTLTYAVSMKHSTKSSSELRTMPTMPSFTERSGILAEKLVGEEEGATTTNDNEDKELPRSNQTIIVCMHLGEPGVPTWPDKCRFSYRLLPASVIVNNTDLSTSTGLIHVPFPESGHWYVTMGLYCHGAETARVTIIDSVKDFVRQHVDMLNKMRAPCACERSAARLMKCINDRDCLAAMNETETLKVKECMMDSKCTHNYIEMTQLFDVHHKLATEQHLALDNCNTSVVFTVSSSPCVAGRCGRFGRCYHYMSGGFVFSTCVCMKGYRGWDCTEDSQVPSSMSILLASLLLTLSNLLFFPSIYMAFRRKYFTEGVIYFFAMFFSIFYHACDSGEDEYSFCLVKIGVLQFCDFYCGLLAIWVTLVAMAHLRMQFVSLLHMLGAILLAFGTELNKQSLWVFLAPALTGICLISTSWGLRCYKTRKWFPARRYLTVFMPLGTVLVMVGLVCFAFLQTKQNYHIVHSVWHMVMALSILCLLPSRKSFTPKC